MCDKENGFSASSSWWMVVVPRKPPTHFPDYSTYAFNSELRRFNAALNYSQCLGPSSFAFSNQRSSPLKKSIGHVGQVATLPFGCQLPTVLIVCIDWQDANSLARCQLRECSNMMAKVKLSCDHRPANLAWGAT